MENGGGMGGMGFLIVCLAVMIVCIAAGWKVYEKAGKPGWAFIVPIYNVIVLLEIVNRPMWWIILMLIPVVNMVVGIIVMVRLAQSFGKGVGFAVGMLFLPFIFYPILGFGDAQYQKLAA